MKYQLELGRNYGAEYARVGHREASQLFDAVCAELHGHEQVVVEHAKRATLDARSGVNYRLLGNSLMVGSPHRPATLDLESVDEMKGRLEDMDAGERDDDYRARTRPIAVRRLLTRRATGGRGATVAITHVAAQL